MSASTQKSPRSYFDWNATAPLAPGVSEAVVAALTLPGNPSSNHREGRQAQALLDSSREAVADVLGAGTLDVVFTSGGTEANHLGLMGLARCGKGAVLVSPAVHPSLLAAAWRAGTEGDGCVLSPVHEDGRLVLSRAEALLSEHRPSVLGISMANHELGSVEDVEALSCLCQSAGCLLFCDAVQAVGRVPIETLVDLVDGLSMSAHKVGGPKGVGALWLRPGPAVESLVGGGRQEAGRRPGTQAVALIAGFAEACRSVAGRLADAPRQAVLRDRLAAGLEALGAILHSSGAGLCNTVNVRFPGVPGDLLVTGLDLAGFAISTGSACSSGTTEPSGVLTGIGLSKEQAMEAVRLSIGPTTQMEEVQSLLEVLGPILERAKRFC
ncbi:MAG: cysteine desulfurase [Myxococcales bacterium]|nr:cysteine desulfurase [Myxococcales bacterium]